MRRILSGLFALSGGAGLMLQVGPHDAATNFCNWLSFWQSCSQSLPSWFDRWAWLFPATLLCVAIGLLIWPTATHILKMAWSDRRGLIDLKEAAAQIYGELRGTDLGRFTEGHTGSADEILDNVGMQILHNADVQVRRQPSPKWERFPKSDLNKMLVCHGATGIRYAGQDRVAFSDPKVSRKDVARVVKKLKENANFVSEWSKAPPRQSDTRREDAQNSTQNNPQPKRNDNADIAETNLIGTANIIFNAEERKLVVARSENIQSVTVERTSTLMAFGPPFLIKFVFLPYQGPFDVRMSSPERGLIYSVIENRDRYVVIRAENPLMVPVSHELHVRFYKRTE
jgi:hypothetical protein